MNAYKVLGFKQEPHHGGYGKWVKNRWRTVDGVLDPCRNGLHYCRADQLLEWLGPTIWRFEDGSPDETIDAGDKMVTRMGRIVEKVETWNERTARLFACDCAERALRMQRKRGMKIDPRSTNAIKVSRAFADGKASSEDLAAAWGAAWGAARGAARGAAWGAARGAAWDAARGAARDAAWDAERSWQTKRLFDYLEGRRG